MRYQANATAVRAGRRMVSAALAVCSVAGAAFAAAPAFTDVTAAAGIQYVQMTVSPSSDFQPFMSGGAAAGDFDGDGWVDLYVTRLDDTDILYRNQRDGTFADVTSTWFGTDHLRDVHTNGAGWGDIDNDGDLDLYVTSLFSRGYHLFVNHGSGFGEQAAARGASLSSDDLHFGFSVAFGDYDRDGWLDLHTTEWRRDSQNGTNAPQNSRLLRNVGSDSPGHFEDVTQAAGVAMDHVVPAVAGFDSQSFAGRFSDLDADGWPDLAVASDHGTSRLFWNNGDGTFRDGTQAANVGSDEFGMGSAIGDIDGDTDLDWFVTSIYEAETENRTGNRLYRNEGDRTFSDATDEAGVRDGGWGWGTAMFDYDLDGDLDIVETNGQGFPQQLPVNIGGFQQQPLRLWKNNGQGVFTEVAIAEGLVDTGNGKGLLTFDYDRDGDLDVFVVNNGAAPVLYRNDFAGTSNWLIVEAAGRSSNHQGIGARITVDPDATVVGDELVREIEAGSHFLGQSPALAHFGLGDRVGESIDRIQLQWPSGQVQQLFNVTPNRQLRVVEPVPEPAILPLLLVGLGLVAAGARQKHSGATSGRLQGLSMFEKTCSQCLIGSHCACSNRRWPFRPF